MTDKNGINHAPKGSDKGGQFVSKEEYENLPSANKLADTVPKKESKRKSQEEFFGEEFKGVKGLEAIEKLLKEKRGHVKNAFERPEIGGIDLVWGDESGGLLHTILKRDKKLEQGKGTISGLDMVRKIPEIMKHGGVDKDSWGRINIDYGGYRVGILPAIFNNKVNWIVTAMELF